MTRLARVIDRVRPRVRNASVLAALAIVGGTAAFILIVGLIAYAILQASWR